MSRPKAYQPGTVSDWHGLTYRTALPVLVKDGPWATSGNDPGDLLCPATQSGNLGECFLQKWWKTCRWPAKVWITPAGAHKR